MFQVLLALHVLFTLNSFQGNQTEMPHTVWLEAETFGPLQGISSFSASEKSQPRGAWSLSGSDDTAVWTQGGASEGMAVSARADEPSEIHIEHSVEIPAAGRYTLWVRYADYRNRRETFGVLIRQGGETFSRLFGGAPIIDELDPMKLLWGWSFAWDSAAVTLGRGEAHVELYTTGPTEARRCIDCLCLTTDTGYRPVGREKPDASAWLTLRAMQAAGMTPVQPLCPPLSAWGTPQSLSLWQITSGPPAFLWNVGQPWLDELKKISTSHVEDPFSIDPPLLKEFLTLFQGGKPPIYGDPLSAPVWRAPLYPAVFAEGSPFFDWLQRNPDRRFALELTDVDPKWPTPADRTADRANFDRLSNRLFGFVAGESIAHASPDFATLDLKVRAATSRAEILAILRDLYSAALVKKLTDDFGAPFTSEEAWQLLIPCVGDNMEAFCHALGEWGVRRIGHASRGGSPTLARRLAFLRGAARQCGARIVDDQRCILGDSATTFSREASLYPASSRYILDGSSDAWAGAGLNWLLKDYLLWYLSGAEAFYSEADTDLFWKPGGKAAGDDFPVQLSPKGLVAETIQRLVQSHPHSVQYTPVAFLVDEAHGWSQERSLPGAFGLDPQLNPAVLTPGRHEANLRAWFDIAYYPASETQNEPATATRQTYVNGIFGDIFDVIATIPKRTEIVASYPAIIAAGEVSLSEEWGLALRNYVQRGGTLVVCAEQFSGPGVRALDLPEFGPQQETTTFLWTPTNDVLRSDVFRYSAIQAGNNRSDRVLAVAPDGAPIVVARRQGLGQVVAIGVPLGLCIDQRPTPILGLLMRHLTEGLLPIKVTGDVEWTVNRLDDGGWLVALFNNRGVIKPEHGILPTDQHEVVTVALGTPFRVQASAEWMTGAEVRWQEVRQGAVTVAPIPAGAVRLIAIYPIGGTGMALAAKDRIRPHTAAASPPKAHSSRPALSSQPVGRG